MHKPPRDLVMSHPSRGAWIEIDKGKMTYQYNIGRTPRGVRGLKFILWVGGHAVRLSHPSRGAWIEIIRYMLRPSSASHVAPLAGCVD